MKLEKFYLCVQLTSIGYGISPSFTFHSVDQFWFLLSLIQDQWHRRGIRNKLSSLHRGFASVHVFPALRLVCILGVLSILPAHNCVEDFVQRIDEVVANLYLKLQLLRNNSLAFLDSLLVENTPSVSRWGNANFRRSLHSPGSRYSDSLKFAYAWLVESNVQQKFSNDT